MRVFGEITKRDWKWWLIENVATKPGALGIIFLCIPLIGFTFSMFGHIYSFQRSGSVMVSAAIAAIYLNHFVSKEANSAKELNVNFKHLNTTNKLINHLKSTVKNAELTDAQLLEAASGVLNLRRRAKQNIPMLIKTSNNIVFFEFLAGVIGTLIWGFGDIPFIPST